MTMRLTQLTTHWTADEAHTVIEFLDMLRDILWAAYGDEIIAMLKESTNDADDNHKLDPEFDDEINF
jgi:hypothetical protein